MMGREPTSDYDFRTFCRTGRGWVFAKVNHRLHKASCPLLPYAYSADKMLWEWEGEGQVLAYLNRYRQGWTPCPHCCPTQASLAICEAAYKAAMRTAHPDAGGSNEQARRLTSAIDIIRTHFNAA